MAVITGWRSSKDWRGGMFVEWDLGKVVIAEGEERDDRKYNNPT